MSIWRDYYRDGKSTYDESWSPAPRRRLILILIAINVGAFIVVSILMARGGPDMQDALSRLFLHPSNLIDKFYLWQLVTYGFCHSMSIFHILWNMLFLYWFGRRLVSRFEPAGFLTFYLTAIVFAGLVYTFWEVLNGSLLAHGGMLGASGAVMAVVLAYACYWPHEQIRLIFPPITIKVWHIAAFFVGMDVFYGLALEVDTGTAHLAHLGGALWGFLWFKFHDRVRAKMGALGGGANAVAAAKPKKDKAAEKEKDVRAKVEVLLERISKDGIGALSEKEKKFLKEASSRYGNS